MPPGRNVRVCSRAQRLGLKTFPASPRSRLPENRHPARGNHALVKPVRATAAGIFVPDWYAGKVGPSQAPAQADDPERRHTADERDLSARIDDLLALLGARTYVALTGAGCSTESGIPDYRGPGRSGPPRQPILHDDFLRRPEVRQRYWARATLGWGRFAGAAPNPAHHALADLERERHLVGVITQNVDRLHHRAGSQRVIELHGALEDVRCLSCRACFARADVHERLLGANSEWLACRVEGQAGAAPDGDAQLEPADVAGFHVLPCSICGGVLKPDVVFFGGNVPAATVADAWALLDAAGALLVVGSSLEVYSGYRFVRGAAARGLPVIIVNQGPTRGDALATYRVDGRAGVVLPQLVGRLAGANPGGGRP
jgi:NAD-dependent deacetylase sirtuin 4